jgi:hypothetical protein
MYVSISRSGTREQVVQSLRDELNADTKPLCVALAEHIEEYAAEGCSVSVSLTGSVSYSKKSEREED